MKRNIALVLFALLFCVEAFADTRTIRRLDVGDVTKYVYNVSHWIEQADLREGESMYGEEQIPVTFLSEGLKGLDWIQTSYFSRMSERGELARFFVKCDADILVAHNRGIAVKPEWLSGWNKTGETVRNSAGDVFDVFSKHYGKDDTVILGPNGDKSKNMYIVAVRPTGPLPEKQKISGYVVDVRSLGAAGDGRTVNTGAIQAAIDKCSAHKNGGTVLIDGGIYVSGTLELKSGVTLHIEEGAILRGSPDTSDFPPFRADIPSFRGKEDFQFIYACGAKDIGITGGGIIDGYSVYEGFPWKGRNNEHERPRLIRMFGCENVDVSHITLIRSGNWTQYYESCRNMRFEEIIVRCYTGTNNQDGIDLSGCSDVVVKDFLGVCGDDVICLKALSMTPAKNIYVENVRSRYANCNIVKIGTETHGDISNVHVRDVEGWTRYSIAVEAVDGSNIDGVIYEDVRLHGCASPFVVRLGSRGRTFEGGPDPAPLGSIRNVTLRNIRNDDVFWVEKKTGPGVAAVIGGLPERKIENVTIEDCDILLYGSICDRNYIYGDVPENEKKYPEFDCFGITPAYGIYVRHADNVTLKNVKIRMKNYDIRPAVVFEDAEGYKLSGLDYETTLRTEPYPVWDKAKGQAAL
ncbi:MAG: glycoside hydrolase family 28 protein [Candidatus Cryptobacteroides sp.]